MPIPARTGYSAVPDELSTPEKPTSGRSRTKEKAKPTKAMNHDPRDIIAVLQEKFGAKVTRQNRCRLRPVRRRRAGRPRRSLPIPARRSAAERSTCSCNISGVDYLETDPKKVAKAGFEPHLEVVYHLQSFAHKHRFTVKVILPRWKDDKAGELPEVPSVAGLWAIADWHEREVYDLCGVELHRPSRPAPHLAVRGLGRASAAQGLRVPAGISRHSRTVICP